MKKVTLKALLKSARIAARKDLELALVNAIQSTVTQHNQEAEKLKKEVKKGAKKLARKLSEKFRYSKEQLLALNESIEVTPISGPAKKESDIENIESLNKNAASIANKATSAPIQQGSLKKPVTAKKASITTPIIRRTSATIEE